MRFAYRRKRYNTEKSLVASYRYSPQKPQKISNKSFELFHRPRVLWTIFQILAVGALALWTVKNYVEILRNL
jgi:hypothetical protein